MSSPVIPRTRVSDDLRGIPAIGHWCDNVGSVHRRTFPAGQTTASKLKALMKHLDATNSMPLLTLHDALVAFARVASRDAVTAVWERLLEEDNLGVWMRTLRGT